MRKGRVGEYQRDLVSEALPVDFSSKYSACQGHTLVYNFLRLSARYSLSSWLSHGSRRFLKPQSSCPHSRQDKGRVRKEQKRPIPIKYPSPETQSKSLPFNFTGRNSVIWHHLVAKTSQILQLLDKCIDIAPNKIGILLTRKTENRYQVGNQQTVQKALIGSLF